MEYQLFFKASVKKDLRKLPPIVIATLQKKILAMVHNPYPVGVQKLVGYDSHYRLRVGTYRVIYEVQSDKVVVIVIKIAHRKDIYRT